jgi:uncharacterized protein (DUF3084 family)
LLLSVRTKKPSREIAQRDEWLLQREARIASLESTISELEKMLREREASVRQREKLSEIEIARREDTLRERETRIAWLEGQVRRLETPRLLHGRSPHSTQRRDNPLARVALHPKNVRRNIGWSIPELAI